MTKDFDAKKILTDPDHLPTIPAIAGQLLSLPDWDNVNLDILADIISKDVALSSKILRAANSPFYGCSHNITTISQALVILGLRAIISLVFSFSLLKIYPERLGGQFDYAGFWTRSLNTAVASRELAQVAGLRTEEEAFIAGLLQDVGVLVIGQSVSSIYESINGKTPSGRSPILEVERECLGTDHVEVARILFDKWNLPPSLRIPILYHHDPEKAEGADNQTLLSIRIQHIAGLLGEWLYAVAPDDRSLEELIGIAKKQLNISPRELEAVMYRVDIQMEEVSNLFELDAPRPCTYEHLLEKANLTLGRIVREQERHLQKLEASKAESQRLAEQLRIANNQLLGEARTDAVTGLANRKCFDEFLHQELERSARYQHAVSLLFIDIDDFKSVNDRYGHLVGDSNLRQLASVLRREVRASDMVARYGGEEFVVVLVETGGSESLLVAERIRSAIAKIQVPADEDQANATMTASIGIAVWEPGNAPISPVAFVKQADSAMYEAKKAGKNCVVFFDSIDEM